MIAVLTEAERANLPASLPQWQVAPDGKTIMRRFRFADFSTAFAFMTRVALLAEAQQHHPDWSNVYDRVEIRLSTHDAGGLTARDLRLARAIDALA
ncbi:MAG: 4a-hydroxytetrahydrobiopterin dehydratase [Rhodospirillales bacterium]|nr:4a-hydroxytetrahydrobiopterin dehydratase [Rhodospirillales bacterium]